MTPRVKAFLKEFPFLNKHLEKLPIDSAKVSRIDVNFLSRRLKIDAGFYFISGFTVEVIIVLDKEGNKITQVGVNPSPPPWWKFWDENHGRGGWLYETIGEALLRLPPEVSARAYFVMSYMDGRVVLYKPPKEFSIQEWVDKQTENERQEIAEEVLKIDAENKDR